MRIIKPQALGVLYQSFTAERHHLCVTVLTSFSFGEQAPEHEAALWQLAADELPNGIIDEMRPKVGAEVLVDGYAYPANAPQPACEVRVQLGTLDKVLRVVGNRRWTAAGTATNAEPFERLRVDWAHAFGGDGIDDGALPNVMRPGEQLDGPQDTLVPAGLSARSLDHPDRVRLAGTYGAQWLKDRAPYPPEDYDVRFHMLAQPDQWLAEPLRGDEPFVIDHMHPEKARIESALPALAARCLVAFDSDAAELRELDMHIDTVRLFPHRQRGVVVWRGTIEVTEDDADGVALLMVGCEQMHQPRQRAHYEAAIQSRLGDGGAIASLNDRELLPEGVSPPLAPGAAHMQDPGILMQRMHQRAQGELDAARQQLLDQGIDPDEHGLPKELPTAGKPPKLDEAQAQLDTLHEQAEGERNKAEQQARQLCAEQGIDYDDMATQAQQCSARPPTFTAAEALASLQAQLQLTENTGVALPSVEALLRDPAGLRAQLAEAETQTVNAYRQFAHLGPRPEPKQGEPQRHRATVEHALNHGESLAGMDLTCADLSDMDLSGINLQGAYLASARMTGCMLTGANLDDTVLAFAELTAATLTNCSMQRTNLGGATLIEADLSRCMLDGAVLDGAELTGAILHDSQLRDVTMDKTVLDYAELTSAQLSGVRAHKARWSHVGLDGAHIEQSQLLGFAAPHARLDGAHFERCCFVDTDLTDASLKGATLRRCGFGGSLTLDRTDLSGARLQSLSWARATARAAVLQEAQLEGVDLTKTDLTGATFYRARAINVVWRRANLQGACLVGLHAPMNIFQRAQLRGADLSGSNLHGADLTRAVINDETCLADAILERAQVTMVQAGAGEGTT